MNEPKPEDVMRALDKLKYGGHSCHDCKYAKWSGEDRCGLNGCRIAKAALALLREKDAEIERLTTDLQAMRSAANSLKMHLEIVQKDFLDYQADVKMEIADARADAITEFVEKLKERMREIYPADIYDSDIDQIANELKEEPYEQM